MEPTALLQCPRISLPYFRDDGLWTISKFSPIMKQMDSK